MTAFDIAKKYKKEPVVTLFESILDITISEIDRSDTSPQGKSRLPTGFLNVSNWIWTTVSLLYNL
jgi:hypothetical protein